jgi:hypothetical protein
MADILNEIDAALKHPHIRGHVIDERRWPIGDVDVSFKGKVIAKTARDGYFLAPLDKGGSRVALTFAAEGRVANTRIFNTKSPSSHVVSLWPIAHHVRFDPRRGLDVELTGSRIQIPTDALADAPGKPFGGVVDLQFTWFDVTDPAQRAAASGDFLGRLLDRSIRRLDSYGIFDLDLRGSNGRPLKLRPGAQIELAIALPPQLAKEAPDQTGFFRFDVPVGRWAQIKTFELERSTMTYNGTVDRFGGQFNLDDPQTTTCVRIRVIWPSVPTPMPNFTVVAHGLQYNSYAMTDSNGFACVLVGRNSSFTAEAWGSVGLSPYLTPTPSILTSPDFSSGAGDCGDPNLCPYVGDVMVDVITN